MSTLVVAIGTNAQGGQQPSAPVINVGFDITGGSDYTTGGYTFDPASQLQKVAKYDKAPAVIAVLSEKKVTGGHWYEWWYDRANGKLVMLKDGADATTSDISATPGALRVLVIAK
jgi:hypothetical protein